MARDRNLEVKVACDPGALSDIRERAARLGAGPFTRLEQVDTYVRVPLGRLKLRVIRSDTGSAAELIGFRRPDEAGSRWSAYHRVALDPSAAAGVREALELTCGIATTVVKVREVAIWSRTRIHLDTVAGLGTFVELETVAGPGDGDAILAEHEAVIAALKLRRWPVVAGSYSDLMTVRGEGSSS